MRTLATLVLLAYAATAHAGGLTYYANRADFDAAHPGLPAQSFNAANLGGQTYVTQASPLDAKTGDSVFAKGTIRPGLTLTTRHPGMKSTALIVYAGGPVGATSVGNNWYGDTLVLKFSPAVTATALNVFANTTGGTSFAGKIHVGFFNGAKQIGGATYMEEAGGDVFIGAAATQPITSEQIIWAGNNDASTFVSTIEFGSP